MQSIDTRAMQALRTAADRYLDVMRTGSLDDLQLITTGWLSMFRFSMMSESMEVMPYMIQRRGLSECSAPHLRFCNVNLADRTPFPLATTQQLQAAMFLVGTIEHSNYLSKWSMSDAQRFLEVTITYALAAAATLPTMDLDYRMMWSCVTMLMQMLVIALRKRTEVCDKINANLRSEAGATTRWKADLKRALDWVVPRVGTGSHTSGGKQGLAVWLCALSICLGTACPPTLHDLLGNKRIAQSYRMSKAEDRSKMLDQCDIIHDAKFFLAYFCLTCGLYYFPDLTAARDVSLISKFKLCSGCVK